MNTATLHGAYEPARASVRSDRDRLRSDVTDLEKQLANAEMKNEFGVDPAYMRLANRLRKELEAAHDRVRAFDQKHRELDARRDSKEADKAWEDTAKAAEKFESALMQAATAAAELKQTALSLADILRVSEPGLWPSRQTVDTAIRARAINVLGDVSGIKLDGFGSYGKSPEPLTKRFNRE